MFRSGSLVIGRLRGARIRLHWSIPVVAFVLCGFRWRPGFLLGFTLLILIHELGHAVLVWLLRHRVVAVEVSGLGGLCHWSGNASPFEQSVIAWGGVLAQLMLWIATSSWVRFVGAPDSVLGFELVAAFTGSNLWLILINLMPIEPLDGARAWQIFSVWGERGPRDLPYGTWRDHTHDVQRQWYDRLRQKSEARRSERAPEIDASAPVAKPPADPEPPLSPEAQRAVDELLGRTTGEVRVRPGDDED